MQCVGMSQSWCCTNWSNATSRFRCSYLACAPGDFGRVNVLSDEDQGEALLCFAGVWLPRDFFPHYLECFDVSECRTRRAGDLAHLDGPEWNAGVLAAQDFDVSVKNVLCFIV